MINIDANLFTDKERFYEILNENFDFDYKVENLDALFDQLIYVDASFRIINYKMIYKNLGDYGEKLMRVFLDGVKMYDLDIDFIS
ncbi:barstar family protein [Anaerococcus marasmi]|uniref:barstar family protein n=1 Tax=Anaerococcus marasmi TaxID=2057797 RepID=UPI000CF843E0|nr:barstar family protein [Anaerococcus marasmi]